MSQIIHRINPKKSTTTIYQLDVNESSYSIIYEYHSGSQKRYVALTVNLNVKLDHEIKIRLSQALPELYYQIRNKRRLPILAKIALILISNHYNIPLYKLVESVTYEGDRKQQLSTNAFIKQAYKLAARLT